MMYIFGRLMLPSQPKQDDDFGIVRSAALAALEPVVHMLVDHPLGPGSPDTMSEVQAALEAQLVQGEAAWTGVPAQQ